ncbi:hypothetical protein GJ697_15170 [Pseudoduganella sp. FT25W]|jgi:ABC-type Fe3+-hydroxamate transport system substrate-binding protein|uniref:Uncharacterized protein n=1 Tax=Duganella alba TaxID=2666081 RepID=A0A6L5QIU7_9BURK|nr:hypothetical protein [Duganella alba]MRX09182.1 hypothetical protein [Duganella alba]MRX17296.1 hypothetical protein [Duganella alba]
MRILSLTLGLSALLVLSACGGSSSHDEGPSTPTMPPVTPPVSMVDKFYSAVLAIIGDGGETTTEPQAIDSIAATTPEDTEPVALK